MIEAFRIVPERRKQTAFNGEGARLFGGRWNTPGHSVVYASCSRALAALEVLVHLDAQTVPFTYLLFSVKIPDVSYIENRYMGIKSPSLPLSIQPATQQFGDEGLESKKSAVLAVPSSIISAEPIFLFHPQHPDFHRLDIGAPERFTFDPRLLKVG